MAKSRPPFIKIEELEKLANLQCTQPEIAAYFGVTLNAVERALMKPEFRAAYEHGQKAGLVSLRRAQFQTALGGNPALLIWLGKQLLGQHDDTTVALTGADGGPVLHEVIWGKRPDESS